MRLVNRGLFMPKRVKLTVHGYVVMTILATVAVLCLGIAVFTMTMLFDAPKIDDLNTIQTGDVDRETAFTILEAYIRYNEYAQALTLQTVGGGLVILLMLSIISIIQMYAWMQDKKKRLYVNRSG